MKRIDIPCKTGSEPTRNGVVFPNNLGFRQPKRGIQPAAISEGIHHLRTLWCRASADQPATERSPGRRLDVFGGKNSIGNHGFYICVHSWKMCEKWVCNHAIQYWYDLAVSEMVMPAGHFKREMMINQRMEWGTQFSGKPT